MELPRDVLMEILAKLPVKSLIRFTSVCKYWRSLIKSSEFVSKHYATRSNLGYDSFLTEFSRACWFSVFSYENFTFETAFKIRPAVLSYKQPKLGIDHRDVIKYINISGPLFKLPSLADDLIHQNLGFGFDSETNDFKVVCFYGTKPCLGVGVGVNIRKGILIYSLAANCWRELHVETMNTVWVSHNNVFSKGRMCHWICRTFLLSFDMVDEVFLQTSLPYCPNGFLDRGSDSDNMYPAVYILDSSWLQPTSTIDLWVLQKYGRAGYWSKQLSVTIPEFVLFTPSMLLRNNRLIVFHNGKDKELKCYDLVPLQQVKSLPLILDYPVLAYTESLVSVQPSHQNNSSSDQQQEVNMDLLQEECRGYLGREYRDKEFEPDGELILENDGDGDASSVDSAFMEPAGPPFIDNPVDYDDYETKKNSSL
ncbi:F-box/kelch-repeat protein At3g23880-like [Chenopodium quinoa]|uniref:F-box/kelch-repeat protein At3g23880-like n=1 Tax=Chenopodium quinoa TaxID=63459 RepID=UPI000B782856|nr:F-box/kelch-repeat protein At3g23880-like [Chenopodium quinoa]